MRVDMDRKTAYDILKDIDETGAYSNLKLNRCEEARQLKSPAFVRELVYGVLRWQLQLDYILKQLLDRPESRLKRRERILLRMGLYQLRYMDSVPEYAAVNETMRLSKELCRGREGFINGVLRAYGRKEAQILWPDRNQSPVEYLSIVHSCEPWIAQMWCSQYGFAQAERMLAASNRTPQLCIRANGLKTTAQALCNSLSADGFALSEIASVPEGFRVRGSGLTKTEAYRNGWCSIQDESSMLAVCALNPQPGQTVIDVCAAPGGKTLFAAERMKNQGRIVAGDLYPARLSLLQQQALRLGVSIVECCAWDATQEKEALRQSADCVLVDAPCSGLGVLRRKPEIKYKRESQELRQLPQIQFDILRTSALYVKPGGTMVYSTCTVNREENQEVVRRFLESCGEFQTVQEKQIFPGDQEGDGFYICKMKRK